MQFARVFSAQPGYPSARIISVEVDLSKGLHAFTIVGLPDKAVAEARDRVSSAIKHTGFTSPKSKNQKVVISLAPADLKKEGPVFDLAAALAYLLAAGDISFTPEKKLFAGELSLDGMLRPITGILPIAIAARNEGIRELFVPMENAGEARLIEGITVYGAKTLREIIDHIDEKAKERTLLKEASPTEKRDVPRSTVDLSDIRGQEIAKRGLLIAASGRHNIVLYGPPGTGKTMLAHALAGILPPLTFDETIEATSIHSLSGLLQGSLVTNPPVRTPHHTASYVSLVGGGSTIRPGEATLAHRGVLFLDEFPEFDRRAIDALREPLENRTITVSRAKGSVTFPANFILIAAMNPTRGQGGENDAEALRERMKTERKISGPIVDRIDMWIEVPHISGEQLSKLRGEGSESAEAQEKVRNARKRQELRFGHPSKTNSEMLVRDIDAHITLTPNVEGILNAAAAKLTLSPRSYHRIIKLARTIADLDGKEHIAESHVLEALTYRPKKFFVS